MSKLLVVEDDQFLRELYVDTLKAEGYEVDMAADGDEAMQKLRQGHWDLILLDIVLPKANGLDIAKKFQAESSDSSAKSILFLTNMDKNEEIKEALQLGKGYLIKSQITPGDLVNEVKLYLSQSTPTPPQTS